MGKMEGWKDREMEVAPPPIGREVRAREGEIG